MSCNHLTTIWKTDGKITKTYIKLDPPGWTIDTSRNNGKKVVKKLNIEIKQKILQGEFELKTELSFFLLLRATNKTTCTVC